MATLSKDEFLATFVKPMQRLGENDAHKPVSIGKYVGDCIQDFEPPVTREKLIIQDIYMNGDRSFYHLMIDYGMHNCFLVIVVDCKCESIHGHYLLDLNAEYGLDEDGWPKDEPA